MVDIGDVSEDIRKKKINLMINKEKLIVERIQLDVKELDNQREEKQIDIDSHMEIIIKLEKEVKINGWF